MFVSKTAKYFFPEVKVHYWYLITYDFAFALTDVIPVMSMVKVTGLYGLRDISFTKVSLAFCDQSETEFAWERS